MIHQKLNCQIKWQALITRCSSNSELVSDGGLSQKDDTHSLNAFKWKPVRRALFAELGTAESSAYRSLWGRRGNWILGRINFDRTKSDRHSRSNGKKKKKEKLISVTFIPHGGLKTLVTVTLESPDKRRALNGQSPSRRPADIRKHKYAGHGTITHNWSHRMAAFALKGMGKH